MKKRGSIVTFTIIGAYAVFIAASLALDYDPGLAIGQNFADFSLAMLSIIPCVFILIGLFEVWVNQETVERHLGREAGIRAHLWVILLASATVGGLYIAFPVAYSLFRKGARLSIVFTYIGAAAVCRIPMTLFEASFLGLPFTVIRLLVSLPLVVVIARLMEKYLANRNYRMSDGGR